MDFEGGSYFFDSERGNCGKGRSKSGAGDAGDGGGYWLALGWDCCCHCFIKIDFIALKPRAIGTSL